MILSITDKAMAHWAGSMEPGYVPVQVLDVSRNGMRISLRTGVEPGTELRLLVNDGFIVGEVRYCIPTGKTFHAGILIRDAACYTTIQ